MKYIISIKNVLNLRRVINLNIQGWMTIFKTLDLYTLITYYYSKTIISELKKILKEFIRSGSTSKINDGIL